MFYLNRKTNISVRALIDNRALLYQSHAQCYHAHTERPLATLALT